MGVKVRKFLGYGLTDVVTKKMELADPRINPNSWLLNYEAPAVSDYLDWLPANAIDGRYSADLIMQGEHITRKDLCTAAVWQPEYGLPNVLALQPVSMNDWRRSDDSIDYVAETWLQPRRKQARNRVDLIGGGLYPWNGLYMDARTGARLGNEVLMWVRLRNDGRPGGNLPELLDVCARAAGFSGHDEAAENIVPLVPDEIRDLAAFAGLFTSDDVWLQLRPLLYTYWA